MTSLVAGSLTDIDEIPGATSSIFGVMLEFAVAKVGLRSCQMSLVSP